MTLDIKYLDVVDLTADNISCKTLSIDGEPITNTFTTNQIEAISGTFTNRDLSKCDANGNGNAGENPNQGYNRFKVWGYSEFYSMLMIKRRQNPGDFYNYFGPCMQITNEYQKTEYLTFGKFRPAYTSTQFGHDFNLQVNSSMNQYIYFGPGNYKNKFVTDANGLIASDVSSFCIRMPALRLDVHADGVVPVGGVSCTSEVLTIVCNSFGYIGPIPEVGQYVTVTATPSTLTTSYAVITSVDSLTPTVTITASVPGMVNATSTAVESVYFGPKITSNNTTTVTVRFNNGPEPEIGQYIRVKCVNSAFNTATDGNPITSITIETTHTIVTYTVSASIPTQTAVVTECSLKFDNPNQVADPKGTLSNIGIHNSEPTSPLDVIGNVTFRDKITKNPILKTSTNSSAESQIIFCDSTQSTNYPLATFDCQNSKIYFQDTTTDVNNTFMTIDSLNQTVDVGKTNLPFVRFDSKLARVAIGNGAIQQISSFGGFLVSTQSTFIGTVQISSPSTMSQASEAVNLVVGVPGSYNVFRTDAFNKRVAINNSSPQWDLHVTGEIFRSNPCCMALSQTGSGQTIPHATPTNLLWQARDTVNDYGPGTQRTTGTGLAGSPFTHAGLGLTCDVATGQFKYATMGSVTTKVFVINAQIGFPSNATGFRQAAINVYQTDGTTVARTYSTQTVTAVSGTVTWVNLTGQVTIANNQSFTINVYQTATVPLSLSTSTAYPTNICIRHA